MSTKRNVRKRSNNARLGGRGGRDFVSRARSLLYPLDEHVHASGLHRPGDAFPRRDHAVLLLGRERQPGVRGPGTRRLLQPVLVLATAFVAGRGRTGQLAQVAAHPRAASPPRDRPARVRVRVRWPVYVTMRPSGSTPVGAHPRTSAVPAHAVRVSTRTLSACAW